MTPVEPVDSLAEWLVAVLTALLLIAGIAYTSHVRCYCACHDRREEAAP